MAIEARNFPLNLVFWLCDIQRISVQNDGNIARKLQIDFEQIWVLLYNIIAKYSKCSLKYGIDNGSFFNEFWLEFSVLKC